MLILAANVMAVQTISRQNRGLMMPFVDISTVFHYPTFFHSILSNPSFTFSLHFHLSNGHP